MNNATSLVYPYVINDTSCINGNCIHALISNNCYVYSTAQGCSGTLAIADETTEKNWFNSIDCSGHNPSLVYTDAVGVWCFDVNSGNETIDCSGQGNTGTCSGVNCPSWTPLGVFGGAYVFDGIDDYINCGNDSSTDSNSDEDFTLEAWINPFLSATGGAIISKENARGEGYNLIYTKDKKIAFVVGGRVVDELKLSLDANNKNSYPGSGSTWIDLSGCGNDGTILTNVAWQTDSFSFINPNARYTTDGYIIWGYKADLYETSDVTIEALAKYNNGGDYGNDGAIWRCDDWSRTILSLTSGGDVAWVIGYSTGLERLTYDLNLAEETWVHLTVTHKDNTQQKIYVNGVEVASRMPDAYNFGGTAHNPNIGRGHSSPYSNPFRGNIAVFQFYHKTLSPNEIKQNYRSVAYRMSLANNATTTDTIPLNEYTHVIAKKEGTTCSIYLNGVLSNSFTCNLSQNLTGTLHIGKRASDVREYFNGIIDEVKVYNRSLPTEEMMEHYQNGNNNRTHLGAMRTLETTTTAESHEERGRPVYLCGGHYCTARELMQQGIIPTTQQPSHNKVDSTSTPRDITSAFTDATISLPFAGWSIPLFYIVLFPLLGMVLYLLWR